MGHFLISYFSKKVLNSSLENAWSYITVLGHKMELSNKHRWFQLHVTLKYHGQCHHYCTEMWIP